MKDFIYWQKKKLSELGYKNIDYILGDGTYGHDEGGPYDRIMVTAAAKKVPGEFMEQLKPNGIMMIPIGNKHIQNLIMIEKDYEGEIKTTTLESVRFVPLVGKFEI